jgi:flagella basal body P-ring formation protein FlgA
MENLQKLRARAYITPGSVISHQHTQIPFIVNSGESVALVRETPSIKVSLRVKALENGRENQWIRVENAHSKKVIQARVVQPGEVSLH